MAGHASLFSQLIALFSKKKIFMNWFAEINPNALQKNSIHGTISFPCYSVKSPRPKASEKSAAVGPAVWAK